MSEQHFDRFSARAPVALNPWKSMWLHPRLTIRQLLDTNPTYCVLLLAIAGGITQALSGANSRKLGDTMELAPILIGSIIGGVITGIIGLYIGSWLIRWTGSWIGGRASSQSIRTALGWSNLPNVWQLLLWVLIIVLLGKEDFASETPILDASPMLIVITTVIGLIFIALMVWSTVMLIAGVAEAQGFTALRAFSSLLLAFLIVLAFALAILRIGFLFAHSILG